MALHHGQLAVYIGEADGALVPLLGERGVGAFPKESHGTRTEPPQGFNRNRSERIPRAVVVGKVVPVLVDIPKCSGMARGTDGGMNVGSSQGMVNKTSARTLQGLGRAVNYNLHQIKVITTVD
jgi:hypothetical protein